MACAIRGELSSKRRDFVVGTAEFRRFGRAAPGPDGAVMLGISTLRGTAAEPTPLAPAVHKESRSSSAMSRLTAVDLEANCPEARDIIHTLGHPPGETSNFIRVLAQSPAALEVYLASSCALADGRLSPQRRAMIGLAVAEINGSTYGIAMHHAAAVAAGLSADDIVNARYGRANDVATHAMLRFVVAVVLQRGDVSDGDFQALRRAGFDDACMAEIVANIATCTFADLFNNMARTTIDYPAPGNGSAARFTAPIPFPPAVPTTPGANKKTKVS